MALTFDEDAFDVSRSHLQRGRWEPRLRLGKRAWHHHGFGDLFERLTFVLTQRTCSMFEPLKRERILNSHLAPQ